MAATPTNPPTPGSYANQMAATSAVDERGEPEQDDERPHAVRADLLLECHGPSLTATGSRSASSSMR